MRATDHLLDADRLREGLGATRIGRRIIMLPEVGSTNTYALTFADDQDADGTVIFAERQTAGRGRLGRVWHCPNGAGLTFTVLLCEAVGATTPAAWMMLAGIAVVRGVIDATDVAPSLRWPNDVYVNDRKLAGILVESRRRDDGMNVVAIGVGINCLQRPGHFPPELRDRATSLDMLSTAPVDRHSVARHTLRALDAALCDRIHCDETRLIELWQSHSVDIGAHVELRSEGHAFRGRIIDVHPRDGLLVQLDDGGRRQFDPATTTRS
ncbi:MAG TPA: biotin--[acetyl-CoA-carboxylase] ligase [Phycisphaerae bacterium]|nr:biotin--[acetyl-CoA-carboxylase] ligase [Phycisphaerae bacterium]HRW51413.1 biotin--[acetyl-CoA-carboxylase] ligase [Phycisphaerae bacterium]